MRCICHLVLALLVALLPVQSAADTAAQIAKKKHAKKAAIADDEAKEAERAQSEQSHRRRRHKPVPKVVDVAPTEPATADAPKQDEPLASTSTSTSTSTVSAADEDDDFEDSPVKWLQVLSQKVPPRRYAYIIGVGLGAVGLAFAYQAQGEAKRAQTITSAIEARNAVASAQASASLANVLYGLALLAVLTAVVLEFVPEQVAEKASLTFHF